MHKFPLTKLTKLSMLLTLASVFLALMANLLNSGSTVSISAASTISRFNVSGYPSPIKAGTIGNFSVTALDISGNTVTDYTGRVHFTSSDPQAALPSDYTFVSGDNGTHQFSATLKTAGTQSITATDTSNSSIAGSQSNITVNPSSANKLAITTSPAGAVAGTAFTTQPVVTVKDAYGNTATSSTASVRLAITSGTGTSGAVLSGTTTINATNGIATFTGLGINLAGTNYTLTATSTGLTSGVSVPFNVIAASTPTPTSTPVIPIYVGGGGGGGPLTYKLSLGGFSVNTPLNIGSNGAIQGAAQLQTKDGEVTLNIAKGTKLLSNLGNPLSILTIDVGATPPAPPAGNALMVDFILEPEGAKFNPPLTLTFKYDTATLPAGASENDLYLAYWDGGNWISLESQIDTTAKTVSVQISHFSQYALLVKIPLPAQFAISDFKVSPAEVNPDNKVVEATPSPEIITTPEATLTPAVANIPANTAAPPSQKAPSEAKGIVPFMWVIIGVLCVLFIIGIIIPVVIRFTRLSDK